MTDDLPAYDAVDEDEFLGEPLGDVPTVAPGERCRGKKKKKRDGEIARDDEGNALFDGFCGSWAGRGTDHVGEGRCEHHGGSSTGPTSDDGKETSSQNAVTHGAFRKHFTSHLTDAEQEAFDDARESLENPAGAQEVARTAAAICLLQFDRTGDERFMRRFESICAKAGVFPDDELTVNHEGLEDAFMNNLRGYHTDN